MKTFSMNEARQQFDDIADLAAHGEPVIIMKDSKLLIVQEYQLPDPVAMRPPGYFENDYDADEIAESNKLAIHSPQSIVE